MDFVAEPGEKRHRSPDLPVRVLPHFVVCLLVFANASAVTADLDLADVLARQGVDAARVGGLDRHGIPLVCGTVDEPMAAREPLPGPPMLPADTRGWEAIPGVIRNDGVETFRLEVDTNGPVAAVRLDVIYSAGIVPPSAPPVAFRDDGGGGDVIAGDHVYTAGPFAWNPSVPMTNTFRSDPDSPAGLEAADLGVVAIDELGGGTSEFLVNPSVGVLASDVADTARIVLAPDLAVSSHLINVATDMRATQRFLRQLSFDEIAAMTSRIYEVLPDAVDFFMLLSTSKIERLPRLTSANFNAGIHLSTKVDYTGTGVIPYDFNSAYGSAGRLGSVNALDAYERGLYSANVTHEILHQWSAFVDSSLGIKQDSAHWSNFTSIESLLGGFRWVPGSGGSYTLDCAHGRNGAVHASPIDKYLMGLVDSGDVPTLRAYDSNTTPPGLRCGAMPPMPILPSEIATSVTIEDIQALHGARVPGPDGAQRDFRIGFVAESHERLLNATEMTFYEVFAEYYASSLPSGAPDPYVGFNWVPIERFFGEGTTWRTEVVLATTTTTTTTTVSTSSTTTTLALPPGSCADPTGDERITASDALMTLRSGVGVGACAPCRCDVDGDGTIDATDALTVLQLAVGLLGDAAERCPPC